MAPDLTRTGIAIRRARERKRMRQKDLAAAVGVSRNTIDAWENARAYPRSSIGALEDVLGISLTEEPQDTTPELAAEDDWERLVLSDPALPPDERADIVRRSRTIRARLYPALEPRSADDGRGAEAPPSRAAE